MAKKDNLVHPYYNHAYNRYDLSIDDIIKGLQEAGYSLDGSSNNGSSDTSSEPDETPNDDNNLDPSYQIVILSTNGTRCNTTSFYTVLYVKLYKDGKDITDTVPATNFKWQRISGDSPVSKLEDAEWNLRWASGSKECLIFKEDIRKRSVFTCQYIEYEDKDVQYVKSAYDTYIKNINSNGGDN